MFRLTTLVLALASSAWLAIGCSDDDSSGGTDSNTGGTSSGTGGSSSSTGGSSSSTGGQSATGGTDGDAGGQMTLCAKYGGPDVVESVMKENVLGAIAGDCRINTFFATLSSDKLTHVGDCLAIMGQELFGCAGITYEGSMSSVGEECRDMKTAHLGLAISQGDFDALIDDVVAGLGEAGVVEDDIMAAAPALLGMADDIVEAPDDVTTKEMCEADSGTDGG